MTGSRPRARGGLYRLRMRRRRLIDGLVFARFADSVFYPDAPSVCGANECHGVCLERQPRRHGYQ